MIEPPGRYDAAMIRRHWLDWSQPCLPQAGAWLLDHADTPGELGEWLVVTPGARAGRLLLRTLLEASRDRSIPLAPPRVVTPSALAEAALGFDRPVATHIERVLAWMHVLRTRRDLARGLMRRPPDESDHPGWHEIATMLADIHRELGGEQVAFDRVIQACEELALDAEVTRWRTLDALRAGVIEHLAACGLADPDEAVMERLSRGGSRSTRETPQPARLVLLGVAELTRVQRAVVTAFADRADALIHAPPSLADRFDDLGCVRPEPWAEATIDLPRESIILCDRPRDQAQAAIRTLAALSRRTDGLRPDQVIIGLGDESLGEPISRAAEEVAAISHQPSAVGRQPNTECTQPLFIHLAPGTPLERTGPWRLLDALQRWLAEPRFAHLAALVRHPDMERWLNGELSAVGRGGDPGDDQEDEAATGVSHDHNTDETPRRPERRGILSLLDQSFSDHLHDRLDGQPPGDDATQHRLRCVREAVASLSASIDGPPAALGDWTGAIMTVLNRVYVGFDLDPTTRAAGDAIRDACRSLRQIPNFLQARVSGAQALRLALSIAARQSAPWPVRAGQIDAVGWLELHLDPSEHVIVTGFNDGRVPAAVTADPFLPDGLRGRLGLLDNRRRLARDAYLLEAMRRSRASFTVILGRHDAQGEPLPPSRLLLAVPPQELPQRVLLLTDGAHARSWPAPLGAPRAGAGSAFVVPDPPAGPIHVPRLRVTQFKAYLACPYRFWLGQMLGLKEAGDRADELDPLHFGSLLHGVLRLVGEDQALRHATRAEPIAEALREALRERARATYGDDPMPAVRVQLARLTQRLEAFARAQAAHRRDGWEIECVEFPLPDNAVLDVPGQEPMPLTARIDRVDRRGEEWLLIDYKSSESGEKPERTHGPRRDGRWTDLQLPLYEHLYRTFVQPGATPQSTRLAYFVLPRRQDDAGLLVAEWSPQERADAVEEARRIVKAVREGRFPISRTPPSPDPFAAICHATVFAAVTEDDADDEEAAGPEGDEP